MRPGYRAATNEERILYLVWRKRDRELRKALTLGDSFVNADLYHARLVGLDLRDKVFRGANLNYADLTEADLRGADLREANLEGAYLTGAQLQDADLRGANLKSAYAIATNLDGAQLENADLRGVVYDQATTWPSGIRPPRGDVGMWHGRHDS